MSVSDKLDGRGVPVNVVVRRDRRSRTQTNRQTCSRTLTRTYTIHYTARLLGSPGDVAPRRAANQPLNLQQGFSGRAVGASVALRC